MTNGLYPTLRTPLWDLLGCDVPIVLAGDLEVMTLYAGQGVGRIRDIVPAGERLHRMAVEAADVAGAARDRRHVGQGGKA